ncbi:hypothetical protein ACHFJ0_09005 [Paracoccus sp. NGMCC 1.201697]|uniref:Uncharacterized protein n=1 Tax=Paracoccus broussonetiae subsp. drimophilus TaxID=3373869 RepID=A0ABW7LJS4_9RHOB
MTRNLKPATESGIKRLAKRLKSDGAMSHAAALDAAARQAGYENYRHFTNQGRTAVDAAVRPPPGAHAQRVTDR